MVKMTSQTTRPPGGDQTGADREDVKGAVLQPMVWNLAIQLASGLDVVSEALFCGQS